MPEDIEDLTDVEPFEIIERAEGTGGEYVCVVVTLHPFRGGSTIGSGLTHRRWIVDGIGEHLHPEQDEYFKIRRGELQVVLDGTEHTLTPGEAITLPAGIPHRHWNPADRPARVLVEHRPARRSDDLLETLYALAQAGRTDERGVPGFLQSMVLQQAYADHAYATDRPIIAQKALAALLAPVGRLAGYKAIHRVDEIEGIR